MNCYFRAFLLLLFFCPVFCPAQNKETDSLYAVIATTKNDSVKVRTLNKLGFYYVFNDAAKASALLKQSERLALRSHENFGYNEMVNFRGVLSDVSGNADSARFYFHKSLQLSKKFKFRNLQVRSINNLGMVLWNTGNFKAALANFLEAQQINETLPLAEQMKFDTSYNNIGLIYQELDLNQKALEYHLKAYEIRKVKGMKKEQAISLNNIGICYNSMDQTAKAIDIYKQGLEVAKESGDEMDYCKLLENLGNAYQSQYKYKEAIACYEEVLAFPQVTAKMKIGIYGSLAAAYNKLNQPRKGIAYGESGLKVLKENPTLRMYAPHLYQYTAQSYYMVGNIEKGEIYNREFLGITKETFSEYNAKQLADFEVKYETAKKEKLLAENKANLLHSQAESRQKNYILIGVSVLALFVVLIGLLVFRQQRLKHSQLEQEHKLKTAIAQIETQNKLQEQRLNISRDLHDNIGAQLTFIISSVENIKYAFDLQNSKLDDKLQNISTFTKSTILELRDTIWAMNNNAIVFEDLRARILNFIEKAKDATGTIDFNFTIDESLVGIQLTSIAGMNIYRTIQEAVNNAIKYSEADKIAIDVQKIDNEIKITIVDNGIGFDIEKTEKGNGLANMEKRIEDIGGIFSLSSEIRNGTTIILLLNIHDNTLL